MESTERAVVRLTEDHTEMTEAGATEWPPLLRWLEQSVTEMVKRGGAGSSGAGIPIDFEALRVLDDVKKACGQIREAMYLPKRGHGLISDVVEAWAASKQARNRQEVDDAQWAKITDELESWVSRIEAEQNMRPRKMELTVPCPNCGNRWFEETPDENYPEDRDQKPAVVIEFGEGRAPVAECRVPACEAMWAGWKQVAMLGFTIQADMDLAVLEACGIKLGIE